MCCAVFGACGDDGDDVGGGSSSTSSVQTSGGQSSGGGDAQTTAQGVPVEGATPREGWCGALVDSGCVEAREYEEWEAFWDNVTTVEQRQDWCGCQLSLRQCAGAPFEIDDFDDPYYDPCAQLSQDYPYGPF